LTLNSPPGFPAADVDVRIFLDVDHQQKDKILLRAHAFLTALFKTAKEYLQNIDQHVMQLVHGLSPEQYPQSTTQKFRLLMTVGQSFTYQGDKRREFYSKVVECAQKVILMDCASASWPVDGFVSISSFRLWLRQLPLLKHSPRYRLRPLENLRLLLNPHREKWCSSRMVNHFTAIMWMSILNFFSRSS
jgi:hypothetical protein